MWRNVAKGAIMSDIGTILVSSVSGGVVAFVGATIKDALDFRTKIDEGLRELRKPVYAELWKQTGALPKWPREQITYDALLSLSKEFRKWYFQTGGMYLSRSSQKRYTVVQDVIKSKLDSRDQNAEYLPDTTYDEIREACSALRTSMTEDLVSRRSGRRRLGF
jgi:hypothetical protein